MLISQISESDRMLRRQDPLLFNVVDGVSS